MSAPATAIWFATSLAAASLVAQQPPAASVRGRVVDASGAPVVGAAVGVVRYNGGIDVNALLARPMARSGDDGAFELPLGDESRVARAVLVAAPGLQSAGRSISGVIEGRKDLGLFVLPPATTLIGRVRDVDGDAIEGVDVRVADAVRTPWSEAGYALSGATSDKRGIFRVPCVPRTGLLVTIHKQGYEGVERFASHGTPLTLTMRRAPLARGRVRTPDGAPLAGASLRIVQEGVWTRYIPIHTTGADGAFTITAPVEPFRYRILATEADPPHRRFESDLLRGAHDEVAFTEVRLWGPTGRHLIVRAIDEGTGEPLPALSVATSSSNFQSLQNEVFFAESRWRDFEQEARVPLGRGEIVSLLIRAPGHAFERVSMPENVDEPLVVSLGPEAVLVGRVVDDDGEPVAGCVVRALPDGTASGGGGSLADHWPRTDEDGRYRIGGLRSGEYVVQVYPDAFPASEPFPVEVHAGRSSTLDMTIPSLELLSVEVVGDLPDGPPPTLTLASQTSRIGRNTGFRHDLARPAPRVLHGDARVFPVGPRDGDLASFELFVPSRARVGAGTMLYFSDVDVKDGKAVLELPGLEPRIVRGRIRADGAVPTERLAVIASRKGDDGGPLSVFREQRCAAGVAGDGTFAIDLVDGAYCIQLVDVLTGIVFHTEVEDLTVGPDPDELLLEPALRWLQLELRSDDAALIGRHSIAVTLQRPRGGAQGAFLRIRRGRRAHETQTVQLCGQRRQHRWLVPEGPLDLVVNQVPGALRRSQWYAGNTAVARESVDITGPEQRLVVTVPSAPTDAELEKAAAPPGAGSGR